MLAWHFDSDSWLFLCKRRLVYVLRLKDLVPAKIIFELEDSANLPPIPSFEIWKVWEWFWTYFYRFWGYLVTVPHFEGKWKVNPFRNSNPLRHVIPSLQPQPPRRGGSMTSKADLRFKHVKRALPNRQSRFLSQFPISGIPRSLWAFISLSIWRIELCPLASIHSIFSVLHRLRLISSIWQGYNKEPRKISSCGILTRPALDVLWMIAKDPLQVGFFAHRRWRELVPRLSPNGLIHVPFSIDSVVPCHVPQNRKKLNPLLRGAQVRCASTCVQCLLRGALSCEALFTLEKVWEVLAYPMNPMAPWPYCT